MAVYLWKILRFVEEGGGCPAERRRAGQPLEEVFATCIQVAGVFRGVCFFIFCHVFSCFSARAYFASFYCDKNVLLIVGRFTKMY